MAYKRKTTENTAELLKSGKKKWVRYDEGAELYSIGYHSFIRLAKEAGAVYHINRIVLVNTEKLDEYMEEIEFDRLWKNENEFLSVTNYSESAITVISRVIKNKSGENKTSGVRLRDYQEEAIKAWVDNGYHGFYVMATGTGKTSGDPDAVVLNGIIMKCHTNKCIRTLTLKNVTESYIVAHADKNGKIFI